LGDRLLEATLNDQKAMDRLLSINDPASKDVTVAELHP
jgi:hypothetical protein